MGKCNYCEREFDGRGLGGHVIRCHQNPNRTSTNGLAGRKISEQHRANITASMRRHFAENPHMIPYRLYHSSTRSNPELLFERKLRDAGIEFEAEFQHGIYTYDFAFPKLKIDLEIDGSTHDQERVKVIDARRDEWSRLQGWKVYRIPASKIKRDLDREFSTFLRFLAEQ